MSTTLYIIFLVLSFILGYVLHPFTFKYVKMIYLFFLNEFEEVAEDTEEKLREIENKIKHQVDVVEEKGEDVSAEVKDIVNDLKDILNIIRR